MFYKLFETFSTETNTSGPLRIFKIQWKYK